MKRWPDMMKNLTLLTQLGLSFITPLLVCLALCWWLDGTKGVGGWVYIPGFFFGLGGSFTVAYKFYRAVLGQEKKEKGSDKVSFNRHH